MEYSHKRPILVSLEKISEGMLHTLLKRQNSYYSNLSDNGQKKFEYRLSEFMRSKNFVGRQNLVVTDEMKILISAAAIQLTFGLEDFAFRNLHTINIFPGIFHSKLYNTSFKGLTTRDGVLSLSWADFKSGYENETDKLNLGLHEMAHALQIDLNDKKRYNNYFSDYLKKWKRGVVNDFYRLKAGQVPFLRSYGSSNLYEFFAVCVEHFFEMPEEFKRQLPNLYGYTAFLLNQDPANVTEDYGIRKNYNYFTAAGNDGVKMLTDGTAGAGNSRHTEMEEGKFKNFLRHKGLYIAMAVTVCGFIGIPILFWFASVTVIGTGTLLILLFCCGMLGLLQWNYVKEYIDMAYHQFTMYAFVGFGICSLNVLLFLNYIISIGSYTKTFPIARSGYYNEIIIIDEKPHRALERNLNTYAKEHLFETFSAQEVTVTFDKGLLNFDKILRCEFH
jgi:Mlc titration factor MtfA (ptsG expression regulator)